MTEISATLWNALTGPLGDPLTRRALLEVCLLGVAGGALGCWVVLYRLSYSTESLAHSLLPGLVIAALTGIPLIVGGAVSIVSAALAIALTGRIRGLAPDIGVAIVVTTLFGAGVLLALSPASPPGIAELLFGNILAASNGDLLLAAVGAAAVPAVLFILHNRILSAGFDRQAARSLGVRPGMIDAALSR